MKRLSPSLLHWVLGLTALVILAGGGAYLWLRSSLPQLDGTVALAGLEQPVEVLRDTVGVPHILAGSPEDAAFALGFVHAQDRLWQMEFNRRLGAGRLAEILGPQGLDYDRFMRTLGLYRLARADFEGFDAPTKARYLAYAAGVNAFLTSRTGALPPEFLLLQVKPEPWTPADSLVWLKLMALDMGYGWRRELDRLQLASQLTPEKTSELLDNTMETPPEQPDLKVLLAGVPAAALKAPVPAKGTGSNNWVIAGSRTESGKPLLANDPHITLSQPGVWYLAHLAAGKDDVVGATFPGLPFVVLGRTDEFAWGFTNVAPDVHDLVVERIDAGAGTYLSPKGPAPLAVRRETLLVKGGDPVQLTIRSTPNGPLISDALPELARALGPAHAVAMRWTMLEPGDRTGQAGVKLNAARTLDAFEAALRDFAGPMQNIVYAHVDGTIGYATPGRQPIRPLDYPGRGLTPAPGWLAATRWDGSVPFDEQLRGRNPPSGFIATANNRITTTPYPRHVTFEWEAAFRHDRIVRRILATPKHSIDTMRTLQADIVDEALGEAARRLAALVPDKPMSHSLFAWNGVMATNRREPLLAYQWVQAFSKRLTIDDVGPQARPGLSDYNIALVLRALRGLGTAKAWCDDVTTKDRREDCRTQAGLALDEAVSQLEAVYGPNREAWRWGERHHADFEHRPFSQVPWLKRFFARSIKVAGGPDAINVAHSRVSGDAIHSVTMGASLRAIYDLADLEASRFMIPTGQSGNPLSPWYDNLSKPWAEVRDFRIVTDRTILATRMAHKLVLEPAPQRESVTP